MFPFKTPWAANGLDHPDLQAHAQGWVCLSSSSPSPQPSREATWTCDHSGAPPTFFGAWSWDGSQEGLRRGQDLAGEEGPSAFISGERDLFLI